MMSDFKPEILVWLKLHTCSEKSSNSQKTASASDEIEACHNDWKTPTHVTDGCLACDCRLSLYFGFFAIILASV